MPDVDVLIVGAGPVGLTARALLDRWGVRTVLVEKHTELSPFPRSRLLNVRSMEIFRQLGIDRTVAARAFAPEYGRVRFRDSFTGPDFASAAMIGVNAPIPESPVIGAVTSQDRLEPTLLDAAHAPIRFGVELAGLAELTGLAGEPDGVLASFGDGTSLRASYVLAADGANSTARDLLGIGTVGPGALGSTTTVMFEADLLRRCADAPAGVYVTAFGSILPMYPEGGWAWFGQVPEGADHREPLARTLGDGLPFEVSRVQRWTVNAFVAERFRSGRVLLAGDAAHAIPPAGGLGMNTGVADVHNLCWKLAGVVQGWARPGLLDTYESERLPVAHLTLRQAVANAQLLTQAQQKRVEQLASGDADGEVELPWSEHYFAQLGLVLGVAYGNEAAEPGTDYVPSTSPGHRMPHVDLGGGRSTVDAVGEWFTLFTENPAAADWTDRADWADRADRAELGPSGPVPVRVERLSGSYGTLLVRPDGHIGARWDKRVVGADELSRALETISAAGLVQ
ncbi:putative polyketide hydroxylase [Catenulispora sp. GAS73]|uniref:FAD-dependent monooxygenase n=1 Tax=Catenulispora sp. GAS73 TaxID=3156269 RepID=UPI003513FFDC